MRSARNCDAAEKKKHALDRRLGVARALNPFPLLEDVLPGARAAGAAAPRAARGLNVLLHEGLEVVLGVAADNCHLLQSTHANAAVSCGWGSSERRRWGAGGGRVAAALGKGGAGANRGEMNKRQAIGAAAAGEARGERGQRQ